MSARSRGGVLADDFADFRRAVRCRILPVVTSARPDDVTTLRMPPNVLRASITIVAISVGTVKPPSEPVVVDMAFCTIASS